MLRIKKICRFRKFLIWDTLDSDWLSGSVKVKKRAQKVWELGY